MSGFNQISLTQQTNAVSEKAPKVSLRTWTPREFMNEFGFKAVPSPIRAGDKQRVYMLFKDPLDSENDLFVLFSSNIIDGVVNETTGEVIHEPIEIKPFEKGEFSSKYCIREFMSLKGDKMLRVSRIGGAELVDSDWL